MAQSFQMNQSELSLALNRTNKVGIIFFYEKNILLEEYKRNLCESQNRIEIGFYLFMCANNKVKGRIVMSAGITAQYGFLYQRYIFIKVVLDGVGIKNFFTYEGIDDIDVSESEGITSILFSSETFVQVKSGSVSRDCWAKVLGNWLLVDQEKAAYTVFLEKKLLFNYNENGLIDYVCNYLADGKTKKSSSIANKVYKKYCHDGNPYEAIKERITSILPKISIKILSLDSLLLDIEEKFKSVYCSDIKLCEVAKSCRCERFIEYVQSEIDSALEKKKSYTLSYQDFISIIGKVNSEINDHKYIINISEMKKRKKPLAENLVNNDQLREVKQLRFVNPNNGFIVKELVNELLYRDFRDVFSISNSTLISNIEETAFSNFEDAVYGLPADTSSRQLFFETVDKEIPLSIVDNSPIYRHGCYVYLTSDETEEEKKITWERKNE